MAANDKTTTKINKPRLDRFLLGWRAILNLRPLGFSNLLRTSEDVWKAARVLAMHPFHTVDHEAEIHTTQTVGFCSTTDNDETSTASQHN